MPEDPNSPVPTLEAAPPNDILLCLKGIWISQAEQKNIMKQHGLRLNEIDEHLKRHDQCLKPLQLSWCACRLIWLALSSSWFAKLIAIALLIFGADGLLKTLQSFKML